MRKLWSPASSRSFDWTALSEARTTTGESNATDGSVILVSNRQILGLKLIENTKVTIDVAVGSILRARFIRAGLLRATD